MAVNPTLTKLTRTTASRDVGGLMGNGTNETVLLPEHGSSSDVGIGWATPYRTNVTAPTLTTDGGGAPKNTEMLLAREPVNPTPSTPARERSTSTV